MRMLFKGQKLLDWMGGYPKYTATSTPTKARVGAELVNNMYQECFTNSSIYILNIIKTMIIYNFINYVYWNLFVNNRFLKSILAVIFSLHV